MGHLISVELDSKIAQRLLTRFASQPYDDDMAALCDAIRDAIESDDAEILP